MKKKEEVRGGGCPPAHGFPAESTQLKSVSSESTPAGFVVWGLGFRVEGLELRVQGVGLKFSVLGFRVSGLGFRVWGLGFRI